MTLVDTRYGKVEGIEKRGVHQFRGIPFAAPPVGELRLRPPQPPAPWTAVWAADQFRPGAPQDGTRLSFLPGAPTIETNEDCLYLNVYTAGTGGPPHTTEVWMYLFTWESPAMEGALRSCHALELPFVWNTLSDRAAMFTGSGPAAEQVAQSMHGAWGALAMSGDPGWDRYDTERRATRIFGPDAGVVADPMGETRRLWAA